MGMECYGPRLWFLSRSGQRRHRATHYSYTSNRPNGTVLNKTSALAVHVSCQRLTHVFIFFRFLTFSHFLSELDADRLFGQHLKSFFSPKSRTLVVISPIQLFLGIVRDGLRPTHTVYSSSNWICHNCRKAYVSVAPKSDEWCVRNGRTSSRVQACGSILRRRRDCFALSGCNLDARRSCGGGERAETPSFVSNGCEMVRFYLRLADEFRPRVRSRHFPWRWNVR